MKIQYQFTITIDFDAAKAVSEKGDIYMNSVMESCEEFAQDLNAWLEKQPLVDGCRMQKV